METVKKQKKLKARAITEINCLKKLWDETNNHVPIIADIGANIGYYCTSFLEIFSQSHVYAYEPHPKNLEYLNKLNSKRLTIFEYGLFNKTFNVSIGVPQNRQTNNGLYSIYHTTNSVDVLFKNANDENIRPEIVKIDAEGSELQILQCSDYFSNTRFILIELLYKDDFKQNDDLCKLMKDLGFVFELKVSKNNHIWMRK